MRWQRLFLGIGLGLCLTGGQILAEDGITPTSGIFRRYQENCPPALMAPPLGQAIPVPGTAPAPGGEVPRPSTDLLAGGEERGGGAYASAVPNMFGDFQRCLTVFVPPDPKDVAGSLAGVSPLIDGDEILRLCIPDAERGAFKIADNESPRPVDRVFFNYNFFSVPSRLPLIHQIHVNREIIGGEKTFLDGDASIGIRAPFFQVSTRAFADGGPGAQAAADFIEQSDFGDLTVILKFALINNRDTGNVVSAGLAVTAPTGPDVTLTSTPIGTETNSLADIKRFTVHSWLFQPYVGAIYNMGDFYVHGFSSIAVPDDSRDVVFLFNDLGVGYFLYRDQACSGWITSVAPTLEVHVNTPLNHRGMNSQPIGADDIVDFTFGARFGIGARSDLGAAASIPVTGPKPFDVEALVQFNYRF